MGRIAGIDFGTVRIGIALSDERHILASAIGFVPAKKTIPQTLQALRAELDAHGPMDAIVIGLPLLLSGKDSPMSTQVRHLAEELKQAFQIPVILWDERFSTSLVERFLKEQHVNRKKRSKIIDALAARAILQNYLDSLIA